MLFWAVQCYLKKRFRNAEWPKIRLERGCFSYINAKKKVLAWVLLKKELPERCSCAFRHKNAPGCEAVWCGIVGIARFLRCSQKSPLYPIPGQLNPIHTVRLFIYLTLFKPLYPKLSLPFRFAEWTETCISPAPVYIQQLEWKQFTFLQSWSTRCMPKIATQSNTYVFYYPREVNGLLQLDVTLSILQCIVLFLNTVAAELEV